MSGVGLVKQDDYRDFGSGMKKPALKFVGDKRVRALLERYACPLPYHAVRACFFGNIATPKLDASPLRTIESFWGGELPEFDDARAANELFQALMGLWNELAKHQSATRPFRLARMTVKPEPDDLRRLCRVRTEELEGFIDGLFGDEEAIELPERASEALGSLGEINAMMRGIVDLIGRDSAPPAWEKDLASTLRNVRDLTRIAEKELQALVLACKRARQQVLSTMVVDRPTIH